MAFWLILTASLGCLALWLFVQSRDSWMLPRWSPRLWYTPTYAAAIGAMTCGPFLMVSVYFWRAAASYVVPPTRLSVLEPGLLLYVLVILQVVAVAVACITLRVRASRLIASAIALAMFVLGAYLLVRQTSGVIADIGFALCGGAFLPLLAVRRRLGATSEDGDLVYRSVVLSRMLIVAWGIFVLRSITLAVVHLSYLSDVLDIACYVAIVAHIVDSRGNELAL